jgi:hypothetical protein
MNFSSALGAVAAPSGSAPAPGAVAGECSRWPQSTQNTLSGRLAVPQWLQAVRCAAAPQAAQKRSRSPNVERHA